MSTPCMIGKRNQDGTITAIYCNFDGYPTEVGLTTAARHEIMMSMPEDRRHDAVEECKTAGVTVTLQA